MDWLWAGDDIKVRGVPGTKILRFYYIHTYAYDNPTCSPR